MRVFAFLCVALLSAPVSAQSPEARPWATEFLHVKLDQSLLSERLVCASGVFHRTTRQFLRDHPQYVDQVPQVMPHCLAVLAETARRNGALDLFWRLTVQDELYDHRAIGQRQSDELRRVLAAAQANQTSYASVTGETRSLPCPLAFDAGFQYGVLRPDQPVPALSPADQERLTESCYAEGSSLSSAYGLSMGIQAGQRHAQGQS